MFQKVFQAHAEFMRPFFVKALNPSEVMVAKQLLRRVRDSFEGKKGDLVPKKILRGTRILDQPPSGDGRPKRKNKNIVTSAVKEKHTII